MVLCCGDGRLNRVSSLRDCVGHTSCMEVYLVLKAHPAEYAEAECKVEEAFVGDTEDDEGGREL